MIFESKFLPKQQRSTIDECRNAAEYQVAGKIVIIENKPGYICVHGVIERRGRSEMAWGRVVGSQDLIGCSQRPGHEDRCQQSHCCHKRSRSAPIEQWKRICRRSKESELLRQWMGQPSRAAPRQKLRDHACAGELDAEECFPASDGQCRQCIVRCGRARTTAARDRSSHRENGLPRHTLGTVANIPATHKMSPTANKTSSGAIGLLPDDPAARPAHAA